MASSGQDCTVRFWNCEDGINPGLQSKCSQIRFAGVSHVRVPPVEFKDVPHELHYHPDEPILAVTCHDG